MLIHDHQKLKADQKFLGGDVQKWVWPVWSRDSRNNRWNKVIFLCWYELGKLKVDSTFFAWAWSNLLYLKNEFIN